MLWIHIIMAFSFFPLAILIMRRFSIDLHFQDVSLEINKTLMIDNVPREVCRNDADLRRHFEEAFPDSTIADIRFAYNVNKLLSINTSLQERNRLRNYF